MVNGKYWDITYATPSDLTVLKQTTLNEELPKGLRDVR